MPDQAGKLSLEEFATAEAWLRKHWQGTTCPMHHGVTTWEVSGLIMTLPYTGTGVVLGGATFPLLVVTCGVCGYTAFVNAIRAGIVRVMNTPDQGII
jgi:hypothetical protein